MVYTKVVVVLMDGTEIPYSNVDVGTDRILNNGNNKSYQRTKELYLDRIIDDKGTRSIAAIFAEGTWQYCYVPEESEAQETKKKKVN